MGTFLSELFGGTGGVVLTAFLALGLVLIFIVLLVWFLKFFNRLTDNIARSRNKRLAVLDSTPIDQKRQLVLVRRDDIEHLLLIGGESDIVVEKNIKTQSFQNIARRKDDVEEAEKNDDKTKGKKAPIVSLGVSSLRHTGLMRTGEEGKLKNNPQTFAANLDKTEPELDKFDKISTKGTDSFDEEADIILSEIEKDSAKQNNKKRRKTDK